MLAYQYDDKGYYAGKIEDYGLLPNNSTHSVPPEATGYIARWNGVAWEMAENHKNEQGYVNGKPFTIRDYGPYPEGFSLEPPEPDEEEERKSKIEKIMARLRELDSESIRPLRAIAENKATDEDTEKLKTLDAEAETLRIKLRELGVDGPD